MFAYIYTIALHAATIAPSMYFKIHFVCKSVEFFTDSTFK